VARADGGRQDDGVAAEQYRLADERLADAGLPPLRAQLVGAARHE
jgi:hypothetical protein